MLEKKITETFMGLVEGFLGRAPFFRIWKEGAVDGSMSQRFLLSFDSLVKSFPALIASGAARAKDEKTRVVLAVNLFQESGEGDLSRTHHAIYRKYLATAGVDGSGAVEEDFSIQWRTGLLQYINGVPAAPAALGALAAGEFLAQPVLSRIYPVLQRLFPQADREYFTKHLDLEVEHVREITELLAGQISGEKEWTEVLEGFKFGLSVWESYFESLASFLSEKERVG